MCIYKTEKTPSHVNEKPRFFRVAIFKLNERKNSCRVRLIYI